MSLWPEPKFIWVIDEPVEVCIKYYSPRMIEPICRKSIAYMSLEFAAVFFAFESAWHFTACNDRSV
ncbi:MAG: hypothetical protein WBE68_06045 [Candidatus Nitrosopolaris sp.]